MNIEEIKTARIKLEIEENLSIERAMSSNDVEEIMKAQQHLKLKFVQEREDITQKSILFDPLSVSSGGYRDKPTRVNYTTLRAMSRVHIIKAIITTRINQLSSFLTPQENKYSTGFIIRKKNFATTSQKKLSKSDEKRIEMATNFLLNCGTTQNKWHRDSLHTFATKFLLDSLTFDLGTAEVIRNNKGEIVEFFHTPADTFAIADSYDETKIKKEELINGYAPSYVQLYNSNIVAQFYPWELMWYVRNPQSGLEVSGYGRSELEDMVGIITSILNLDQMNLKSAATAGIPKGIIKYTGNMSPQSVEEFRKQWSQQLSSPSNYGRIPLLNSEKMEFVNTSPKEREMEYSQYQIFLIKICCSIFRIDPTEVGFESGGNESTAPLFEGSNAARLKYSKDKGLNPLLYSLERNLNFYLFASNPLFEDLEVKFVGINADISESEDLDQSIKKLTNFQTLNEVREMWNLKKIKGGDVVLNQVYLQAMMQSQQGNEQSNQFVDQSEEGTDGQDEDNPFLKALEIEGLK